MPKKFEGFNFPPGKRLAGKYEVDRHIGGGWEGEVYQIRETKTGAVRAAKFYYPHRNPDSRTAIRYARKLEQLADCPILIRYHHQDSVTWRKQKIDFVVSEFVRGRLLSEFLASQPGKRLHWFQALHLLYDLARGLEAIHRKRDYHGDIHSDNIMVNQAGLQFEVKLVDVFHWGAPTADKILTDVIQLIKVFHECLGGRRHYARQPDQIKRIVCGLKHSLIAKRFKNATRLREALEELSWENGTAANVRKKGGSR